MKNIIIRICKWLLPLFGVSVVSCDEGGFQPSDEYGTPHADFEIKGRVLESSRSQPVQGLQVSSEDANYGTPSVTTDAEGRFTLSGSFFPSKTMRITVEDVDGDENGGLFSPSTVTVALEQKEKGDGWYGGVWAAGDVEITVSEDISSDW